MADLGGDASLEELMAVMAHDLNNPIAALITNLSFLESSLAPGTSTETAEALADAQMLCDVLRRLAGNIDLMARRGGPSSGANTASDLVLVGREAIGRLAKQAAAAEVELVLDAGLRQGDVIVRCDRGLCARAIDNLIAFGIERAAPRTRLVVTAAREGTEARVEVRYASRSQHHVDPPPTGAPPAQRRRYIQAAYGRGLSLYCVHLAATLLGGRLDTTHEHDGRARLCLVASCPEER
ncbi:sensor histidine kinase [Polyangium jinanense]|uniref:histidine kinase n=1 Tax=Polyangium jinanense TaxID=2829994 RepID=A0A9X3WZD9_9BACT|nr:histidine kinase dimerization/phospho-acceptor domain-containing protein [Polyangium jinanense]MDC3954564.1 HAMP domain-containing histidine kinase [Polyangium jinanense]MDC3980867.1 HAMP domain-containing histidine kinase [Polyangium jinanense]